MAETLLRGLPMKRTFTLRDVVVVIALAINPIVWYAKIDAHVADKDVHPNSSVRQIEIRAEMDRDYREFKDQVARDIREIKNTQLEMTKAIGRIEGKVNR